MSMEYPPEQVRETLRVDAFGDAERVTGKSYKEDKATESLGVALHIRKNMAAKQMLESNGDAWFGCPLSVHERILGELGAERLLRLPFASYHGNKTDSLNIWWSLGILFVYDTYYGEQSINSGHFYYNWRPKDGITWQERCQCTSSGCMTKSGVWYGDHDIREATKLHIATLREYGELLPRWAKRPHLWLCHYMDTKNELPSSKLYDQIRTDRLAMLPPNVLEAIVGSE